ncbi:hypothetical protein L6452_42671 [Arctium lappa]|uniref:Uncharacterized protein n=1 Tax=Arctium lappa TaxID=4217 RepID=A0ACB8XKN1_ARCLA|nr:hypothetical protein L6452_42671 [Arctium lappa]
MEAEIDTEITIELNNLHQRSNVIRRPRAIGVETSGDYCVIDASDRQRVKSETDRGSPSLARSPTSLMLHHSCRSFQRVRRETRHRYLFKLKWVEAGVHRNLKRDDLAEG